jgi:hypothetical protein
MNDPDGGKRWYARLLWGALSMAIVGLVVFFWIQSTVHAQRMGKQQAQPAEHVMVAQAANPGTAFLPASDLPDVW